MSGGCAVKSGKEGVVRLTFGLRLLAVTSYVFGDEATNGFTQTLVTFF
jgi:hypothetical protein